jgi:hypothetical protein
VLTPKLLVNIIGPNNVAVELVILDTRVEANVMLYELAKSLRCLILSTKKLKLKTISS